MSGDFTEVSNESWFSRLGKSIAGVLVGGVLFILAFPLLFLNEGYSVKTFLTLEEGKNKVVSVGADKVEAANSGKLIHVTGKATTAEKLSDPEFGVSASALKLNRQVEMYQWKEKSETKTEKQLGGGEKKTTKYSYDEVWSDRLIDSSTFNKKSEGHVNPDAMPFESTSQVADPITLGGFTLPKFLVEMIDNFETLPVAADAAVPKAIKEKGKVHNGRFYVGADPASPAIGDVRISFKTVSPEVVSVIAQQVSNTFEPYHSQAGGELKLLEVGEHSPQAMIQTAQDANVMRTWILRGVGTFIMFLGLMMMMKPLSVLADVVPFIGSIVGAGTGIIAFLIAVPLSLLTIAIAWLFYRPVLGVSLIAVALVLVVLAFKLLRKKKPVAAATA
ncbi:MAG: TMEM43 family protein [Planctomycetia bacterium]|nr:TMEM43 family protein [Planctomycetia bacterium]